jgi:hypothetical protein
VVKTEIQEGKKCVKKSAGFRFFIPFQHWRMHALAWSIGSGRGNKVEQMQDEELAGTPVAGQMAQMWDDQDEQLAGTPAAGLTEQIQDEQLAGDLAVGLAGSGAPSGAQQSFSLCKMTQCPNRNLVRS